MTKKNTLLYVLLILFVLFIIAAVLINRDQLKPKISDQSSINIAVLIPLTGDSASQGELIKQGLDMATDEIQASGQKINLVYSDTQGDPQKAVGAYLDLQSREHISAMITWGSSVAMDLLPLANRDHIIQMGVATAAPDYRTLHDYNFRDYPTADQEEVYIAGTLKQKFGTDKTVAIFYVNNDYGKSSSQEFTTDWQVLGGQIKFNQGFDAGQNDYRSELAKIKQLKPDLVVLDSYAKEGGIIIKQAGEIGIKTQFVSPSGIFGDELTAAAGTSVNGLIVSDSLPDPADNPSPELQSFAAAFQKKFGRPLTDSEIYTTRSYDALRALAAAFKPCGSNTECAQKQLEQISLPGPTGTVAFDQYGDIKATFHFVQFQNGAPKTIK